MRHPGLTITVLGLFCATAASQEPAVPPMAEAEPASRLGELLDAWEAKMGGIQTFYAECKHTALDKTLGVAKESNGSIRFMRPNKARLELVSARKTDEWERWICSGDFLYQYDAKNKRIQIFELKQDGKMAGGTFLEFILGMKAKDATERYELRLNKEDQWWIYVDILPKDPRDKQEFTKAQMCFHGMGHPPGMTMLPKRLWFQAPNGDEETWEFAKVMPNPQGIQNADFVAPPKPEGWTVVRATPPAAQLPPAEPEPGAAPRLVRPNDGE